nr:DMT family transporter [Priestia aryabhattai]MDH3133460.1 DMT family transporter [Priestia aryabhattai]
MNTSLSKMLILCAAVLWGTTGTAQALASAEAHSVAIGAVRLAVGGLSLLAACLIQRKNVDLRCLPILPLAVAAASMAAYQPLFFFSRYQNRRCSRNNGGNWQCAAFVRSARLHSVPQETYEKVVACHVYGYYRVLLLVVKKR